MDAKDTQRLLTIIKAKLADGSSLSTVSRASGADPGTASCATPARE